MTVTQTAITSATQASTTGVKPALSVAALKTSKKNIKDKEEQDKNSSNNKAESKVTTQTSNSNLANKAVGQGIYSPPPNSQPSTIAYTTAGSNPAAAMPAGALAPALGGLLNGLGKAFGHNSKGPCTPNNQGCQKPNPDGHNQQNQALSNASPQDLMKISANLEKNATKVPPQSPLQKSLLSLSGAVKELADAKQNKQTPDPNLLNKIKTISGQAQTQLNHSGLKDKNNQALKIEDLMKDPKAVEEAKPAQNNPEPPKPLGDIDVE